MKKVRSGFKRDSGDKGWAGSRRVGPEYVKKVRSGLMEDQRYKGWAGSGKVDPYCFKG